MKPNLSLHTSIFGALILTSHVAHSASGTWTQTTAGPFDWSLAATGNWSGGVVADGADSTANFTANLTANQVVNLAEARTIGNITFTDSTTSSHNLAISGANILTFDRTDATKPTVNVTQAGRTLTIGSVIAGNDGLLKSGAGTLIFNSASNNTFTGGFDINGGIVQYDSATHANAWGDAANVITFTGSATLHNNDGAYTLARGIAVNSGATATLSGAFGESTNITGAVTGAGDMNISGGSNGWAVTMSNTANTLSGTIWVSSNSGQNTTLAVNSLADGDVGKKLKMGAGTATATFTLQGASATPIVWSNRGVELAGTTGAISIINNSSNSARTLTINPNLAFTTVSSGNKTLTFDGSNTGANTFAGNITNNGTSTTAITKTGGGTWALGGTNTYSGVTNLLASGTTGRLVFQGSQSLSPNTSLVFAQSSSSVQSVRFLDDAAGTINFARPISFGGTNTIQGLNIFVGNNNTANLGSSAGATTGSTIQAGTITFTSIAADTNTTSINVTGANGYRLQTGAITLNNLVTRTAGQTTVTALNPTTANMTVDSITMATGNTGVANDGVPLLRLDGTSSDNYVTGTISNATDYLTGQALSLQKQNTSTWTLSGANTFTGTTTVSNGVLILGNSLALQNSALNTTASILGTASAGLRTTVTTLTLGGLTGNKNFAATGGVFSTTSGGYGSVTDLTLNPNSGSVTYTGVIADGAAGMTVNKTGLGTQVLSGNNTYTGATNVTNGMLVINGINSTSILTTASGGGATLAGNGTLGATSIQDGATLSPGVSGVGTLSMSSLTLGASSLLYYELTGGTSSADLLDNSGALSITSGSIIDLVQLGTYTAGDKFTVIAYDGAFSGMFTDMSSNILMDGATFTDAGGSWMIDYNDSSAGLNGGVSAANTYVTITAIPEPNAVLLGGLGLLALLRRRRQELV